MGREVTKGETGTVEQACGEGGWEVDEEVGGLFAVEDELVGGVEDDVAEESGGDGGE